jgi:uncharacterized protein (TIGR03083 family)
MPLLDALAREAAAVGRFLSTRTDEDWARPTRCAPMTVFDLAAHVRRGWARIEDLIDAGPLDMEAEKDAATYFRFDREAVSPQVLERAQEEAARLGTPAALLASWSQLDEVVARARTAPDAIYPTLFGAMRMYEYLRTRVVELVVHHMDLRDALGLEPEADPEALTVAADVLRQLLGTDLRPAVDDVRFCLIGTGRAALDPDERAALGPLVDMFPLLA